MHKRFRSLDFYLLFSVALAAGSLAGAAAGQASGPGQSAVSSVPPTFRTVAQLVVVDVTVTDKSGHPVHGLRREDFIVTENRERQVIQSFEETSPQTQLSSGPELPPMPPGTFSDYTPVPPHGPLNVLLLDTLNTPMADQSWVRNQLRQYIRKAAPGTQIAIFGLSRRLFLLQGFSSDQQVLRDAVDHKLIPRASSLLDDPQGSGMSSATPSQLASEAIAAQPGLADTQLASVVSSMQQFEAEQASFATQLRIQYTLDAFNALAHYLAAFPGRKNLIWFSGSFPVNLFPDPALADGSAVMEDNSAEFRETTSLLSQARVAIDPVDARGLRTDPTFSGAAGSPRTPGQTSAAFYQSQASEHMTMSQLAEETGGRAFYNTNDLAAAVQNAVESGSSYYTVAYQPANRNPRDEYRQIRVTLRADLQAAGYNLAWRHGYFVRDPHHARAATGTVAIKADSALPESSGDRYMRVAMAHGAPAPQDILFKARILPIGTEPEQSLASNNKPDLAHPIKPPYRRFSVDLAAVPDAFQLTLSQDGHRTGAIDFCVFLYNNDGTLLNATEKNIQLSLTPETWNRFRSGVYGHFEISVPLNGSDDFLRIGMQDVPSGRAGVIEVPVASVARLHPLPATPAAAAQPANVTH